MYICAYMYTYYHLELYCVYNPTGDFTVIATINCCAINDVSLANQNNYVETAVSSLAARKNPLPLVLTWSFQIVIYEYL